MQNQLLFDSQMKTILLALCISNWNFWLVFNLIVASGIALVQNTLQIRNKKNCLPSNQLPSLVWTPSGGLKWVCWLFHTDINFPAALNAGCAYMTPLICASKFGSLDACRLLIQNGAHITKKSCNGQSPLHYAARKGHTEILKVGFTR